MRNPKLAVILFLIFSAGIKSSAQHCNLSLTSMATGLCANNICITPGAGTAPYSFLWPGGQTGSCVSNLVHGVYQITVTDGTGCWDTITVTVVNSFSLSLVQTGNPSCG